jgi:GT2 family glycosyltransferase
VTEPQDLLKVVITVLTWRGYEVTRACLKSLQGMIGGPYRTLVIDNDSGTGEGQSLAAEFADSIEVITLPRNEGVSGGYNAALRWAAQENADYVLLLNNDTVVDDPHLVVLLVGAMGHDVAAAGPSTRDADGAVFSVGGLVDMNRGRGTMLTRPPSPGVYDVDWLDGCCVLVSVDAARRVGGFATPYFMYWEELDWCVRARSMGYRCVVDPSTWITHHRSSRDSSMQVRYWMLRNGVLFMRRHGSWRQNATSLAWTMLYRGPGMIVRRLRRPRLAASMTRAVVGALVWNVRDAVRHRRWRIPADGPSIDG